MGRNARDVVRRDDDLLDDDVDRRSCERYPAAIPVRFRPDGARRTFDSRTWDIAERGVCVRATRPIPVGTQLELEIEVVLPTRVDLGWDMNALIIEGPAVAEHITVPGVVRRNSQCPDGSWDVGIEFSEECGDTQLQVVENYLGHLRDGFRAQFM